MTESASDMRHNSHVLGTETRLQNFTSRFRACHIHQNVSH